MTIIWINPQKCRKIRRRPPKNPIWVSKQTQSWKTQRNSERKGKRNSQRRRSEAKTVELAAKTDFETSKWIKRTKICKWAAKTTNETLRRKNLSINGRRSIAQECSFKTNGKTSKSFYWRFWRKCITQITCWRTAQRMKYKIQPM